jgi:histidinol-phosphate aminotransferase/imidazoleglycerol-phosphate dehydratase/histidinol-phosphatase
MKWFEKLVRPDLLSIPVYSSAVVEAGGYVPPIKIDANENPWPPFGSISKLVKPNRYIEQQQPPELLQRLAIEWSVSPDQMMLGRGSDEGIDMLIRLCCVAGQDNIIICPPTFAMYDYSAKLQNAAIIKVPLTNKWQLDVAGITKAITPNTKLIFFPSPHAPMGHLMKRDDVMALLKATAEKVLVVVDEAYIAFSDDPKGMVSELKNHTNLVILRTLSKAYALAGERIGAVIAHPEITAKLRGILAPYPLPQSSVRAALDALSPNGLVDGAEHRKILVAERKRLEKLLPQSPFVESIFPSDANFLLVKVKNPAEVLETLKRAGILARNRSSAIPNTIRFSVSTPDENDLVLRAMGVELTAATKGSMPRLFSSTRGTKETQINVTVNLDKPDFLNISTGIGFFDHMLSQLASHGGFGLALQCNGDLHIDQHHTIEDCALALGEALKAALGDKRGIARFGFTAPLDEALAQATVDLSGRPFAVFTVNGSGAKFPAETIGGMSAEMVPHFFHSLAVAMACAIHITVTGDNAHHMAEASFKATGRALRQAFQHTSSNAIPSTKGVL